MDRLEQMECAQQDQVAWLVVPDPEGEGSLRRRMEAHLQQKVAAHNEEVAQILRFLETGEAEGPLAEMLAPYLDRSTEQACEQVKSLYLNRVVDLGYVLYGYDGFSQHFELADLDDLRFLEVYNRVLLQLRALRLPDQF